VNRRRALAVLGALLAVAVALVGVQIGRGALSYGTPPVPRPCEARPAFPGDGTDAAIQRIVLDGLQAAACKLGVTREELVLSLSPTPTKAIRWDPGTVDEAVKAGLHGAVDEAHARGEIGGTTAFILTEIVDRAPVKRLVEGGSWIAGLIGGL